MAFYVSYDSKNDAREPLAKEKAITPISMIKIQKICSPGVFPEISP